MVCRRGIGIARFPSADVTRVVATWRTGYWIRFPNAAPIPAVTAIAKAPQNVTRMVALSIGAPPAFAATAPSNARNTRDARQTAAISV